MFSNIENTYVGVTFVFWSNIRVRRVLANFCTLFWLKAVTKNSMQSHLKEAEF